MRTFLISTAFFMTLAIASAEERTAPSFEQSKSMALQMMDKRIADMQNNKACMSKAKNHDEMKACRTEMQADRKEMRSEMQEMRSKMKKERK